MAHVLKGYTVYGGEHKRHEYTDGHQTVEARQAHYEDGAQGTQTGKHGKHGAENGFMIKPYFKLNEDVKNIFENTWAYKIITMANDKDINDERFYNMMAIGKTFFEEIFKEIAARTIHY